MSRTLFTCLLVALFLGSVVAQKPKPWTELTEKEAAKILNDSPWGQTQVETREAPPSASSAITSVMASRSEDRSVSAGAGRVESGETKPDTSVRFRIRFLSAKPVRAAFARILVLRRAQNDDALTSQLQGFVDRDFGEYVVVALTVEAANSNLTAGASQMLKAATVDLFKDKVYLERKDGKRLGLADYRPPGPDGMGAKFVFMRTLEGQPFLNADSDNVRFFAQFSEKMKLNLKYKVSEMMYDGKLEY